MNSLHKSTAILFAAARTRIRAPRVPFALLLFVLGSTASAATVQIQVGDNGFKPQGFDIQAGDTVQWVWTGGLPHSVTSIGWDTAQPDGRFDSGIHSAPFTFSVTFPDAPQSFPYECRVHRNTGYFNVRIRTGTLGNISTRASVETGDRVTIGGFIVGGMSARVIPPGGDQKQVLIRALGPSLGNPPFNVSGSLQDPTLELHNLTTAIATNDDWQQATNANENPAALRPTDSRESAMLVTLQPGNYTAIMAGKTAIPGIGLVEVYDMNTAATCELVNVSTRGFVGTGDSVMIGGFIATGDANIRVLIRALGPTLAASPSNVPGVLANPFLALKDANGTTIAVNDNWKDSQQAEIQMTQRTPPNDLESAIVTTVVPGNYTAIVSGVAGGTGIALVEVYKEFP